MRNVLLTKCLVLLALLTIGAIVSCDTIKVPGNVAGQCVNAGGQGQGFMSVQIYSLETGHVEHSQNTNDSGSFMFKMVDPGEYGIRVIPIGGGEIPDDIETFKLSSGKTIQLVITLYREGLPETTEE